MEFEKIKAVWDSQENCTVFAIDLDELHRTVRNRSRLIGWTVSFEEFMFVLVCLGGPAINGWFSGEYAYESIGAVIYGAIAIFILRARWLRIRHEKTFSNSVRGELDRSIYRLSCQIWRAKNIVRWFLLPAAIYTVISNTQHFTWTGIIAASIGYPLCYLAMRYAWKSGYEKQKLSLEALRTEFSTHAP